MDSTSLKTSLPLGKPYWKLVAKNEETQKIMAESSIYRADIQPRFAPTVLFPLADAKIPAPKAPFDMAFKWQAGNETSRIVLEVAKDPALKQKIATKNFTTEETFTLPALSEGEYFWRMSSYYEGSEKPATGKIQKFTITKAEEKVVPKDPVQIVWTVPEDKIQFYLENPKLGLSWNGTRLEDISIWRLKYFEESEDSSKAQSMELKENKQEIAVQKPGRYIASIEAIDKEGKVIGSSSPRKIAVAPLPTPKRAATATGQRVRYRMRVLVGVGTPLTIETVAARLGVGRGAAANTWSVTRVGVVGRWTGKTGRPALSPWGSPASAQASVRTTSGRGGVGEAADEIERNVASY
jgi:hypothetical protein